MPMGAVVATALLIECMKVVTVPESGGLIIYCGFGELGDAPEYEAAVKVDPCGDFLVDRWLWVFQDVLPVKLIPTTGRHCIWSLTIKLN